MNNGTTRRTMFSGGLVAALIPIAFALMGCAMASPGDETGSEESTESQSDAISGCQGNTFYASSYTRYLASVFTYLRIGPGYGYQAMHAVSGGTTVFLGTSCATNGFYYVCRSSDGWCGVGSQCGWAPGDNLDVWRDWQLNPDRCP